LGFAYTSKIDLEFEDRPSIDDISNPILNLALRYTGDPRLKLDMEVPQTATVSATYNLDSQWKLLGSLGWQDWSEFGKIGVEVDANNNGIDKTVNRKYKDSWHASLGTQYQFDPKMRWNIGVGYDSSIVDDKDRTVDMPQAATWRFATGFNYSVDSAFDFHLAYTLGWLGDMDVEQTKARSGTTLSGKYTNTYLHILGGGVVWHF
jgi:long-chain fatty acid transport protein